MRHHWTNAGEEVWVQPGRRIDHGPRRLQLGRKLHKVVRARREPVCHNQPEPLQRLFGSLLAQHGGDVVSAVVQRHLSVRQVPSGKVEPVPPFVCHGRSVSQRAHAKRM